MVELLWHSLAAGINTPYRGVTMENPFDSDAIEPQSRWLLQPDVEPHQETVHFVRSLGGSGEITVKELTLLAYYLNENREARHSWPGELLFQSLAGMFDHRTPSKADRDGFNQDLEEIERECSRVAVVIADEGPEIALDSLRVEELPLPVLDKTIEIFSDDVGHSYNVNLHRQSCSCPGWSASRSKYNAGDLRRCCTHMIEAYLQVIQAGELPDCSPVFHALMEDRVRRGRSLDPKFTWRLVKIKLRPHLVIHASRGWSYVYAPGGNSTFSRYAFEVDERRWAFGHVPGSGKAIESYLDDARKKGPA